jgi:hypothetical protein
MPFAFLCMWPLKHGRRFLYDRDHRNDSSRAEFDAPTRRPNPAPVGGRRRSRLGATGYSREQSERRHINGVAPHTRYGQAKGGCNVRNGPNAKCRDVRYCDRFRRVS